MTVDQIELGTLIRKRRKSLGLTLSDLAGENISVPTISNIERGVIHNVNDEKITYLLEKLNLDETALKKLKKSESEERDALELELSIIANAVENRLYDMARKRINTLEKTESVQDESLVYAKLQLLKGLLYRRQNQWDRAERIYKNVIRLVKEAKIDPNTNIETEAYYFLAQCVFYRDQDYEQSLRYSELAQQSFMADGDNVHLEGRIYYDQGIFHYQLETYASAYECFQKTRAIAESLRDMRWLSLSLNMEANVLKQQKMYTKAIALFKRAIDISTRFYANQDLASTLHLNLGDTFYHAEEYDKAKNCYDVVHELCQKTKNQRALGLVYSSYGEVFFATGEYDKAADYADQALGQFKKVEDGIAIEYLRLLILRANVAVYRVEGDYVTSLCEEGIVLSEKTKKYGFLKEFHYILATYYDKIGNKEKFIQETNNMYLVEKKVKGGRVVC